MIGRRAFGMMMRGLAREGRRRCHKHRDHDRDQAFALQSSLRPQIFCALFAPVRDDIERHLGAFAQIAQAGLFDCRDVDEHVLAPLSGATKP